MVKKTSSLFCDDCPELLRSRHNFILLTSKSCSPGPIVPCAVTFEKQKYFFQNFFWDPKNFALIFQKSIENTKKNWHFWSLESKSKSIDDYKKKRTPFFGSHFDIVSNFYRSTSHMSCGFDLSLFWGGPTI